MLIYANGNNDLEPEIWESKINIETSGTDDKVCVIIQIGRISRKLVEIVRPKALIPPEREEWAGVRRYEVKDNDSVLISDLGNINMADPKVLHDFIKWGFRSYPSKRRLLIVGGHGFSFVAVMTDFSQDMPYMMGVSQMIKAINLAMSALGECLDVIILDACYMNTIEIIYELGRNKKSLIKYLMTYIKDGPLKGLPYGNVISSLKRNLCKGTAAVLKSMVGSMDMDLVVIEINRRKLKSIKSIANSLSYTYLRREENKSISPEGIIYTKDKSQPWYEYVKKYKSCIEEIIICFKSTSLSHQNIIDIAHKRLRILDNKMDYIALIYLNLSFCRNNFWSYILTDKSLDEGISPSLSNLELPLEPIVMHPKAIRKIIGYMNMPYAEDEINDATKRMLQYKNWTYDGITNSLYKQLENILPR